MTEEERYDEAELRDAGALAEALERAPELHAPASSASDALDAAELIAASQLTELSEARAEAVLRSVQERIEARRSRRRRRFALGLAAVASTLSAAAAVLLLMRPTDSPALQAPVAVSTALRAPEGGQEVVLAQRAWLGDPSPANRAALRGRLAQYRTAYVAELDRRLAP